MSYIDSKGNVVQAPVTFQITQFFNNIYLALILFFATLFSPNSVKKLPPSRSLQSRKNIDSNRNSNNSSNGGGGGGGGGGGRGFGGGGSGSMADLRGGDVRKQAMSGCSSCG